MGPGSSSSCPSPARALRWAFPVLMTAGCHCREKVATLDYMHLKMCSLHDQLSHLPLEGSMGAVGGGSNGGTPPKCGGPGSEQ